MEERIYVLGPNTGQSLASETQHLPEEGRKVRKKEGRKEGKKEGKKERGKEGRKEGRKEGK
ncbi:hypothetical protein L345_06372, partial [Ophiophagus hannah]